MWPHYHQYVSQAIALSLGHPKTRSGQFARDGSRCHRDATRRNASLAKMDENGFGASFSPSDNVLLNDCRNLQILSASLREHVGKHRWCRKRADSKWASQTLTTFGIKKIRLLASMRLCAQLIGEILLHSQLVPTSGARLAPAFSSLPN